jgi:hypothetical protein
VGQSSAGKKVRPEAEDVVEILKKTTDEDAADREDFVPAVVNCSVCELAIAS